ncbi:hypothetical protein [Cedecea colo]|uniref:DUF551 domain-containing protein n=1 Tax=Cedecea colo TaxID=2552946 RepID=A0ABX0VJZ3_9ENTR|nr:hypothetical protein [Cedecea colo]NIY47323.1 hypothetical protein [Cedecea colo]
MTTTNLSNEHLEALNEDLAEWETFYEHPADIKNRTMFIAAQAAVSELLALREAAEKPVAAVVSWNHPTEERKCDIRWLRFDVEPGHLYAAPQLPAVPDGWVMVPKEPTQAMCAAFNDSDYGRKSLRERYSSMLAAAPQLPGNTK